VTDPTPAADIVSEAENVLAECAARQVSGRLLGEEVAGNRG
jgi:hypothetical protein